MKRIFALAFVVSFAACNSSTEPSKTDSGKSAPDSTGTTMRDISSPYPTIYSSKFQMSDPKYAEAVLGLWKDWDNGNLSNGKNVFADTVQLYFYDGSALIGARDSVMATAQAQRNKLASSVSRVDAVMAVKSTDRDENWALIWGMEKDTDKNGKVDSTNLHESWRFNKDGKVDLLYQYKEANPPMKKK